MDDYDRWVNAVYDKVERSRLSDEEKFEVLERLADAVLDEPFDRGLNPDEFVKVHYLEEIKTLPDKTGPGGRNDTFFWVEMPNTAEENRVFDKFCFIRLQLKMRWWEDVLGNGHADRYPREFIEKYPPTWEYND